MKMGMNDDVGEHEIQMVDECVNLATRRLWLSMVSLHTRRLSQHQRLLEYLHR